MHRVYDLPRPPRWISGATFVATEALLFGGMQEAKMYPLKILGLIPLVVASSIAMAQPTPSNMGVLTCTLVPSEGEARPLSCGFKPTSTGGEGRYVGTIRKGQGHPQGKQIIVWTVLGAGGMKVGPEALGQRFSSQPGEPGKLVGETNPAIMLQPETPPGVDNRDSITEIELKLTSNPV
jgi:hypothetical protein